MMPLQREPLYHIEWEYGFVWLDYAFRELTTLAKNQKCIPIGCRQKVVEKNIT